MVVVESEGSDDEEDQDPVAAIVMGHVFYDEVHPETTLVYYYVDVGFRLGFFNLERGIL